MVRTDDEPMRAVCICGTAMYPDYKKGRYVCIRGKMEDFLFFQNLKIPFRGVDLVNFPMWTGHGSSDTEIAGPEHYRVDWEYVGVDWDDTSEYPARNLDWQEEE